MNPLYVGIDVSSKSNVVYFMLPDGSKHCNFSVANSNTGSSQLVKRILSAMTSCSLDTVLIGLEATSVYGDNLVYFLREDAALARFNSKIHVLNPKQVSKFKEAYNDLPKNDLIDSFVIAKYLLLCHSRILLKEYVHKTLLFFDEVESAEALADMDLHELTAFIMEKGKNRFPNPNAVAKSIQKAARSSYRLPKTVNDSVNQVLSISITSIKALEAQIKEFDKAIAAQMELLPNVLISIPGIVPVFSAGIMAEIGDINRFHNQAQLAKYAGLAWKQHQSGDFEAQTTRLINSGNRFLKYYLCEAAFSLVRCDKEYSDFYHLKYKEVNRYQHKRALALTARKFVRLVFRLLKDNRLYTSAE